MARPCRRRNCSSPYAANFCTAPSAASAWASGLRVGDELVFQRYEKELEISISTARSHVQSIYGKLAVHSRTQAVARAREVNLL